MFGAPVAEYGQSIGQPFGFTGREQELESGLVYARARWLNPSTGRFDAPDRLEASVPRNGALVADAGLRQLMQLGGSVSPTPQYQYASGIPTLFRDPSGLTVLYAGVGGTVATFAGGVTGGLGMGIGGSPFGAGLLATFGLAFQAGLINISVTADLGIYFNLAHDHVCDLKEPFLVEGGDFGGAGISLAWGVDTTALEAALARGDSCSSAGQHVPRRDRVQLPTAPVWLPAVFGDDAVRDVVVDALGSEVRVLTPRQAKVGAVLGVAAAIAFGFPFINSALTALPRSRVRKLQGGSQPHVLPARDAGLGK